MTNSNLIVDKLPPNLQVIWTSAIPLHEKIDATSGQGFDVNRWGSCQYASALSMFDCMCLLKQYLSEAEIYQLMGIQITLGEPSPNFHQQMVDYYRTVTGLDGKPFEEDHPLNQEYLEFSQTIYQELTEATNVDQYFDILKSVNDLWTVMPIIFESIYPRSHFPGLTCPGQGPELNQMMQSDNLVIGLQAWLLVEKGWVTEPDTAYEGFDT